MFIAVNRELAVDQAMKDKIVAVLAKTPTVVAAWIFGSAQHGVIRPGSDLDIGVLFIRHPSWEEAGDVWVALQAALQLDAVDMVTLNGASAILRFEAISGQPTYCRDVEARAAFASLTARQYEESMALIVRGFAARKAVLARAKA